MSLLNVLPKPGMPDGTVSKSFMIYLMRSSGWEPIESVREKEAKLGGWLDEPSVYDIHADQWSILLPV